MRVAIIQHVKHEPAGSIETFLQKKSIQYEYFRVYDGEFPEGDFTHYVIMGGPMGAYEEEEYPFIRKEKEMIRRAYREGRGVLGICLGAQLIASAFGKAVYPFRREVGWFEVERLDDELTEGLPDRLRVVQWHNDTFEIPEGAKLLFRGDEVPNQGFRLGKVIGLQFHMEVTEELLRLWAGDEGISEDERQNLLSGLDSIEEMNAQFEILLARFFR